MNYTAENFQGKQPAINHLHWDGSIPAEALFAYYQDQGQVLELPDKDIAGNPIHYDDPQSKIIDSAEKLAQFQQGLLTKWDIVDVFKIPIGAMKTPGDLQRMAIAHCEYLQSQRVVYAETRFAPAYHLNPDDHNSRNRLPTLNDVIEHTL